MEVPTWWPSSGERFQAYTHEKGLSNAWIFRFGPYKRRAEEPEYMEIGGPFLDGTTTPNPAWYARQRQMVWNAYGLEGYAFIVPFDSWGFKHSQWGDVDYIEMPKADIDAFGHTWTPAMQTHLEAVAENFTCFGNLIVELDNEGDQVDGYDPEFYRTMLRQWRAAEQKFPCELPDGSKVPFVHIVGTSVPELLGEVDYTITHARAPVSPVAGRWRIKDEHNPAFDPTTEAAYFKNARDQGLEFGLWRDDMEDAAFEETMRLRKEIASGGPPASACPMPLPESATVYIRDNQYGQLEDGTRARVQRFGSGWIYVDSGKEIAGDVVILGADSSIRIRGSAEYCAALGHTTPATDCNLEPWPKNAECSMELAGGCPVWQYQNELEQIGQCEQVAVDPNLSCDHFGSTEYRDDPETPDTFEGRPIECGLQRDALGNPKAGFFCQPHGKGWARACLAKQATCGQWLPVDH